MGWLERILPKHNKRTNHVFLASEDLVFPPDQNAEFEQSGVTVINDDRQLSDVISNLRQSSKLKNPGAGKKIIDNILRSTQINLAFIKFDLTKWVNEGPVDVHDFGKSQYIILREDNVSDGNLSEFLNMYCSTAPMSQPHMIILPNQSTSSIEHRLRFASGSVSVSWLESKRSSDILIARAAPSNFDEFAGLFDRRCFEAVARVETRQLQDWSRTTPDIGATAMRLARLRARILTAERAAVEPEVDELLSDLDEMTDAGISRETEPYLLTRSLGLLQKAYCSENPSYVHEALAISSTLGHELGVAMCLRYAHFLDVHAALESHMLTRAEKIFHRNDCPELAFYCVNNRLLSGFTVDDDRSEEFSELINEIDEHTPSIHRREDIYYNAGVEHLFAGRAVQAAEIFKAIDQSSAAPLIMACAKLGLLICQSRLTGRVSIDAASALLDFVRSRVARSNRWHITNILLNLLTLFEDQKKHFRALRNEIAPHLDLRDVSDVRDTYGENRLMATRLGLDNFKGSIRIGGRFGAFYSKTGLTMPYFFIWS